MRDLATNLVASLIAGITVWFGQRVIALRRTSRKRQFFGVRPGAEVLLIAPHHVSSVRPNSVHRLDVAALIEVAVIIRDCGGMPIVQSDHAQRAQSAALSTEYCIGGPLSNTRTMAYLRLHAPGVRVEVPDAGSELTLWVGDEPFRRVPNETEYAICVRAFRPGSTRPVFLIVGHVAMANLAAARYLASNYRKPFRTYGADKPFCIVVRLTDPTNLGITEVEYVADKTQSAFRTWSQTDASVKITST